jgi:hypothetical protein
MLGESSYNLAVGFVTEFFLNRVCATAFILRKSDLVAVSGGYSFDWPSSGKRTNFGPRSEP